MLYGFAEYRADRDAADAGGKGAVLATLFQKGYPVPDGFIIGAQSFSDGKLPDDLWRDVLHRLENLPLSNAGAAVRSSGAAEDGRHKSFAGEFESVLGVNGEANLRAALDTVISSARSERVLAYDRQHAANAAAGSDSAMAVVVQAMLRPDFAGVLFTTDPITQDRNTLCGNYIAGLGEALVAGAASGDAFTIDRTTGAYNGPPALASAAAELRRLALAIEADLGCPQDVEWALQDGRIYILQSRPITTLGARTVWNSSQAGDYLWTNTNVGEAIGDVMTPYTWSAVRQTFDDLYRPPAGFSMLGNIGGHVYLNVSVLLAAATRLGFSEGTAMRKLEAVVGPAPSGLTVPDVGMSLPAAAGFAFRLLRQVSKIAWQQKRFRKWARETAPAYCNDYLARIDAIGNPAEALALGKTVKSEVDRGFGALILVTNIAMEHQTRLRAALQRHLDDADVETLISGLGGDGLLHSMGPMVAIEQVARNELDREQFIRDYGHRGPNEMELSQPRTAEDPAWIDKLIRDAKDSDVGALLARQRSAREKAWLRLEKTVSTRRAKRLRRMADKTGEWARDRELIRSELVRFANVPRRLAVRVGAITGLADDVFYLEFDEIEQLLNGDDSATRYIAARKATRDRYQRLPALPNWISGKIDLDAWPDSCARRTDYFDDHVTAGPADIDTTNVVRGAPGAAGVVEGTVRVIDHYDHADRVGRGEILVTSFTNVGWTPLFPRLGAIVTDVGAPLSHAAIVARELGIPAVVGTGCATMRLKDGDRVRVNGSAGTVQILN